jgi:YrbI family 3-deoxy-D-manno-octulosonate 8-phosphate phosphatase
MENKVKLLVLDVDGVMTNGRKTYNIDGEAIHKEFNDKDFTAIKKLKASGVEVVFLSGDKKINEKIAQKRNIRFYYSDSKYPKEDALFDIGLEFGISLENTAGIGDDLFDMDFLKKVEFAYCPSDAIPEIKSFCTPLSLKGGEGVVVELFSIFEKGSLLPKKYKYNDILELDQKELW